MINLMVKWFIKSRKKKLWAEVLGMLTMVRGNLQARASTAPGKYSSNGEDVKSIVGGVPSRNDTFVNTGVHANDFVSVDFINT